MKFFTFGLDLGSALVLVALLHSVFVFQSVFNMAEVLVILNGQITIVYGALFTLIAIGCYLALTIYLWVMGVFKGRKSHLAIWTTGILLFGLLNTGLSIKQMYKVFSTSDFSHLLILYWRKLLQTIIAIGLDWYVIGVAVQVINFLWRAVPQVGGFYSEETDRRGSQSQTSSILMPIGIGAKRMYRFYSNNPRQAVKLLLMLDIILTSISFFTTSNLNWVIQESNHALLQDKTIVKYLILMEEGVFTFARVVFSIIGFCIFTSKAKSNPSVIRCYLISHLILIGLSITINFFLLAAREDLSTSEQFHLVTFTLNILFRFWIAHYIWKHLENIKLRFTNILTTATASLNPQTTSNNSFKL